jgi:SWIM zinc finger
VSEVSKRAAKKARSIRLVRPPGRDGVGVFCITAEDGISFYAMHELPCEIGGRGFAVHRLGLSTLYHVRVGETADCSCECKGFLYRSQCRHVAGLLALMRAGVL